VVIPYEFRGYEYEYVDGKIRVLLGYCADDNGEEPVTINSQVDLLIDPTTVGVNGMDTGGLGSNCFMNVFVIVNPTTEHVGGLLSVSKDSPTLPEGYTKKRFIGYFRTVNSQQILDFAVTGKMDARTLKYRCDMATHNQVLGNGTVLNWTSIDVSHRIPSDAKYGCYCLCNMGTAPVYFRPYESEDDGEIIPVHYCGHKEYAIAHVTDGKVEYKVVSGGVASAGVCGFEFSLAG